MIAWIDAMFMYIYEFYDKFLSFILGNYIAEDCYLYETLSSILRMFSLRLL